MRVKRVQLRVVISERTDYESNTAEGQAENARFNSLVSSCTVYNDTGKPVFNSMDDYLNRSTEEAAAQAATERAAAEQAAAAEGVAAEQRAIEKEKAMVMQEHRETKRRLMDAASAAGTVFLFD